MAVNPKFRIVVRKGEAFVRPASDVAEKNLPADVASVIFKNTTADKVFVHLPGKVFKQTIGGASYADDFTVTLDEKGGANDKIEILVDTAANSKKGLFSYKVYCAETKSFAQGNSDPEFIIDN